MGSRGENTPPLVDAMDLAARDRAGAEELDASGDRRMVARSGRDRRAVDHRSLFAAAPTPFLILTPDLMICEVNQAYLDATGRERSDLVGRHVFDAFPDNPEDPDADGVRNLNASLQRALSSGVPDVMALQKYDIAVGGDRFEERWWSPINTPVLDDAGSVALLIHRVEDATAYVRAGRLDADAHSSGTSVNFELDLIAGARKLQELNEQLRRAHAREHEVALELQRSMLPAAADTPGYAVAVRYLPADSLHVCGDWYDVIDLGGERLSVSVGDVVGHGLRAAGVMGQLRSALIAASLSVSGPADALDVLDRFARTIDRALGSTAAQAVIDKAARTITYSSAGHLPPMLLHPDGTVELLDEAPGLPLATYEQRPRPQASVRCDPGCSLVLYTDGLMERRRESLDVGLKRLADTLTHHADLGPEDLADAILADLKTGPDTVDDTALLVVQV